MNLRDLQYVVRVADLGHFGRAATACHVSQPTLSGQILKLEQELGVTIFERSGRQVRLTRTGEKIVAEARRATEAARAIASIAAASRDPRPAASVAILTIASTRLARSAGGPPR